LDVKIIPAEKCRRYIEVTMPPEEFEPKLTEALQNQRKRVQLHGFRKGKAPMQLVKQIYGNAVREKTIEDLVPKIISDAREQYNLKTVGPAHLEDVKYDQQAGLQFRAYVEVAPEIELRQYKGLEFEKTIYDIGEQDVANALENLREQYARMEKVDGEAQPGHLVLVDLQQIDATGLPIIGNKYEDRRFQIVADGSDEEFTKPLIGARLGDSRKVEYRERRPDGTPAETPTFYQATIKEISEKKLPAVNDEFAREVGLSNARGKIETLEELKKVIRQELEQRAGRRSQETLHHEIIDELLKTNPFDLPEELTESYVKSFAKNLQSQFQNLPPEALKDEARAAAIRRLRWEFLLAQIAQAEGIEVSDEEVREHLISLALSKNEDPQRLINQTMNDEDRLEKVRAELHEAKILQFLEKQMKIRERRIPFGERDKQRIITV
jgi:trigger factor